MNIIINLTTLAILIVGIYYSQRISVNKDEELTAQPEDILQTEDIIDDIQATVDSKSSPTQEALPTPTPTKPPILEQKSNTQHGILNEWVYPKSKILASENSKLTLESLDNEETITNWYKEKIKSQGMNTRSFVQTSANGNVLNKLVAANTNQEIEVEITQENNQAKVNIKVTIK